MLRKRNALFALTAAVGALTLATALPTPQESPEVTEHHKMLTAGAGTWEGTMTTYMMGETSMPARETVVAVGEFWTHANFECEFMGMPYNGMGALGYDPDKGKFVGTWIDNMTTSLTTMEGDYDPDSRKLTMHWMGPDMAGNMVPHYSENVRSEDGNGYAMTFFIGEGDAATKQMKIEMTRTADKPVEAGAGR